MTPQGPATVQLRADDDLVLSAAWGPGSAWMVDSVPALLGALDDAASFPATMLPHSLAAPWRRYRDRYRVPRSGLVLPALVAAICEQKVTGVQARRAWYALLRSGPVAPGPSPDDGPALHVLPDPAQIAAVPGWQWHRWGLEPAQARTLVRAMGVFGRLEQAVDLPPDQGRTRFLATPGIGRWTWAQVAHRALGDADAVAVGDYHVARRTVHAFTGRTDGTDADLERVVAPFAGHRYRVQRLVELAGSGPPRRGPRMAIADNRRR